MRGQEHHLCRPVQYPGDRRYVDILPPDHGGRHLLRAKDRPDLWHFGLCQGRRHMETGIYDEHADAVNGVKSLLRFFKLGLQPSENSFLIGYSSPPDLSQEMNSVGLWKRRILESFIAICADGPQVLRRIIAALGFI